MSTENIAKQQALEALQKINAVDGFDPSALAVAYTDLNTGEKSQRLPVMAQMGWFRLKYPDGRIAVTVTPVKEFFVATARIYPNYSAQPDQYLAEATASRGYLADKPTVSPREWAQTAAIGIALRNAGFGLQFGAAGDSFESPAVNEVGDIVWSGDPEETAVGTPQTAAPEPQLTAEELLERAKNTMCPIVKYKDRTLGEVALMDPGALVWVATKFTGGDRISAAAKLLCEQAQQMIA